MSGRTPAPNRSCDSIQDNYLGLLRTYDSDNNGRIDIGELGDAGDDFAAGRISQEEVNVVDFAFNAGCSFPAEPPEPPENESPNARFSISPQSGTAPFTATLDASASNDPDGSIQKYLWAFSDGRSTPNGKRITERFTEEDVGTINVGLTVEDDDGAKDFQRKSITVKSPEPPEPPENESPNARFSISPQSGTPPFTATLDASASNDPDGSIREYLWAFSDRRGSPNGKRITERFTKDDVGTINVGLTVKDDDGDKDFQRKSITVRGPQNEPPEARASYSVR